MMHLLACKTHTCTCTCVWQRDIHVHVLCVGGAQASPSKGGHPAPVKGSLPVSVPPGAGNVSSKVKDQLQQKPVRQQYEASNSPLSNRVMVASVPEVQ